MKKMYLKEILDHVYFPLSYVLHCMQHLATSLSTVLSGGVSLYPPQISPNNLQPLGGHNPFKKADRNCKVPIGLGVTHWTAMQKIYGFPICFPFCQLQQTENSTYVVMPGTVALCGSYTKPLTMQDI
jgi:hypothetical protein